MFAKISNEWQNVTITANFRKFENGCIYQLELRASNIIVAIFDDFDRVRPEYDNYSKIWRFFLYSRGKFQSLVVVDSVTVTID